MGTVRCLLIVDDEREDVVELKQLISSSHLKVGEVLVATSLAEALLEIKRSQPEVILLDMDLGDSRSLDTLRVVREMTDAVVIVLSETEDEALGCEAIRAGADDFLGKRDLCDVCLKSSILHSMTRRSIRQTTCRIRDRLDTLSAMAGV